MRVLWGLLTLSLALQVDAQCRDIASENQRALMIGQQVCFQCPLTGSTFSWTFQDTPILPMGTQGFANGTLVINSVAEVHLAPAFFRCVADGVESDPYRLVQASISPPSFVISDKTVNESTDVTVFCRSSASPTPHVFQWTYEGTVVSSNAVLQLNNVQRTQTGVYTCTTTNVVGTASANITLTVQFPPANTLTSAPVVVHQINHTLSCSFDGLPRPTVTWRLNGTTLVTGRDNYVIREVDNTSHVDIVGTKLSNSGDYECEVQNLLGSDSKSVSLTVQVPPYAPTGLTVTGVTTTSFQLMWTNPFDGNSDLETATITLTSVNGPTTLQAATLTSHDFGGLVPNRDYQIEVVVRNTVGPSPPGSTSTSTLPLAPAQPISFTVTSSSSTQLLLRWMPPANDPRATPITSWVVRYRTGSSSAVTEATITTPSTREYPLSNLMKGTLYMVSLAGVNSAGLGSFTAEESQRTMFDSPSEPLNLQQTLLNPRSANIRWDPSADSGGSPLLNYRVELRAEGEADYSINGTVPHPTVEYQLTLEPETTYMVRVSARNMDLTSYGPPSDTINFTTPQLNFPPASGIPPLFSELTDTSVTISFQPLVGVVTVYVVEYHLERLTGGSATQVEVLPTNEGLISTTIGGLAPDSPYLFRYFSRNELGDSDASPYLRVATVPSVTISEPSPSEMTEGSDIVLECLLDDGTPASNATWLFEDRPVSQLGSSNVEQNGHRLTIGSAMVGNSGNYSCRYVRGDGAVAESRTEVNISPTPTPSTLPTLLIIIVSCVAGGGLILLILVIIVIILYCYYRRSTNRKGNYKVTNGKPKSKSNSTWIEASGESDAGTTYLPSSHYPTVRSRDSRTMLEGTPYDYHSPEATDHQPYSTFSTLEHKRVHNMEPRYATPPPPVISEHNEMHMVSLSSPPPMYGREDMV